MRRGQSGAASRVCGFADAAVTTRAASRNIPAAQGHVPDHRLSPWQAGLPSVVSDIWRSLHHGRSAGRGRSASWRLVHPGEDDEGPARR